MPRPKLIAKRIPVTFRMEETLWLKVQAKLQQLYGGKDYSRRNLVQATLWKKWLEDNK